MSKEESILSAIYNGKVSVWDSAIPKTVEYNKDVNESLKKYEQVRSLLDDSGKELFEEFLSDNAVVCGYFEEERFNDGFILGSKLMLEIMEDKRFNN